MNRVIFFLGLFVLVILMLSNQPKPSVSISKIIHIEHIKAKHIRDLDTLEKLLVKLLDKDISTEIDEIKYALKTIRLRYKTVEPFVTYFSTDEAKFFLNSAPLPRLEKYVPEINVIPPHGLQVLEEIVYGEPDQEQFIDEVRIILDHLKYIVKYHNSLQFEHRQIFELSRLALIRTFTLGVSGFDAPYSKNIIPESAQVIRSIHSSLNSYLNYNLNSKLSLKIDDQFRSTLNFLSHQKDVDRFDRYTYLKNYILPLYKAIHDLHIELGIETINELGRIELAYNYNTKSFFDESFLNKSYFSHYESKFNNDLTAKLGRILFFDPILSKNNERACASCHQPNLAFTDARDKSPALSNQGTVKRNSPTVIDAIFSDRFFYDLRAPKIEKQFLHVINGKDEFDTDFSAVISKLKKSNDYVDLFQEAFPNHQNNPINTFTFSTALGSYISSLTSYNSVFDRSLSSDSVVLSEGEKKGFNLFMGKALCATCHFPPNFSGLVPPFYNENESEVIGVPSTFQSNTIDQDLGRFLNGRPDERSSIYKNSFKTTTVRNIAYTAPYMHNGVFKSLEEVMEFYNNGGGKGHGYSVPNQTLPFDSLKLNKEEISNIIAFLHSLSDTTGLTSIPTSLPSFGNDLLNKRTIGGRY